MTYAWLPIKHVSHNWFEVSCESFSPEHFDPTGSTPISKSIYDEATEKKIIFFTTSHFLKISANKYKTNYRHSITSHRCIYYVNLVKGPKTYWKSSTILPHIVVVARGFVAISPHGVPASRFHHPSMTFSHFRSEGQQRQ